MRAIRAAMLVFPLFLAAAAAHAQDAATVYVVTYIEVAPSAAKDATAMLRQFASASRKDAGLIQFAALRRNAAANHFAVLEIWKDQAAFDAHRAAAHSKDVEAKLQPLLLAPVDERLCITTAVAPFPRNGDPRGSLYVITHVDVAPANRDSTVAALNDLVDAGRKDPGNVRFDVMQQKARSNHFEMVEIWSDQKADDAHELTAPAKAFRAKLGPMLGALYDRRWYRPL